MHAYGPHGPGDISHFLRFSAVNADGGHSAPRVSALLNVRGHRSGGNVNTEHHAATNRRRVAAITGAGSGIGEATAHRLSAEGYDVAILDVDQARAERAARNNTDLSASALPIQVNVTSKESIDAAFLAIEGWRKAVDVLVNSAGIINVSSVTECSPDDFRRVMEVNVTGTFLCAQRAAEGMIAQRYGRIINLASISAERAGVGRVAYGTSKGAVASLTRQLAMELGSYGITANSVAPGPVSTAMTEKYYTLETRQAYESMIPARRLGTPSEIAHVIAFLASEEAGYVNGVMLPVDGGYLAAGVGITGAVHS